MAGSMDFTTWIRRGAPVGELKVPGWLRSGVGGVFGEGPYASDWTNFRKEYPDETILYGLFATGTYWLMYHGSERGLWSLSELTTSKVAKYILVGSAETAFAAVANGIFWLVFFPSPTGGVRGTDVISQPFVPAHEAYQQLMGRYGRIAAAYKPVSRIDP